VPPTSSASHLRVAAHYAAVTLSHQAGLPAVVLRDKLAGLHTLEVSAGKARTAASFRATATELAAGTVAGRSASGIRHASGVIMVGGGLPIEAGGKLVGAIDVCGAPASWHGPA
jgi:uncharacterized protein GlcG (DUF336 family)